MPPCARMPKHPGKSGRAILGVAAKGCQSHGTLRRRQTRAAAILVDSRTLRVGRPPVDMSPSHAICTVLFVDVSGGHSGPGVVLDEKLKRPLEIGKRVGGVDYLRHALGRADLRFFANRSSQAWTSSAR